MLSSSGPIPGLEYAKVQQVSSVASVLRFAFPFRAAPVGIIYSYFSALTRPHWVSADESIVMGIRRVSWSVRFRACRMGIDLPTGSVLLFDFANRNRGDGQAGHLAIKHVLPVADHHGITLIARVRRQNLLLRSRYAEVGFVPLSAEETGMLWICRRPRVDSDRWGHM